MMGEETGVLRRRIKSDADADAEAQRIRKKYYSALNGLMNQQRVRSKSDGALSHRSNPIDIYPTPSHHTEEDSDNYIPVGSYQSPKGDFSKIEGNWWLTIPPKPKQKTTSKKRRTPLDITKNQQYPSIPKQILIGNEFVIKALDSYFTYVRQYLSSQFINNDPNHIDKHRWQVVESMANAHSKFNLSDLLFFLFKLSNSRLGLMTNGQTNWILFSMLVSVAESNLEQETDGLQFEFDDEEDFTPPTQSQKSQYGITLMIDPLTMELRILESQHQVEVEQTQKIQFRPI